MAFSLACLFAVNRLTFPITACSFMVSLPAVAALYLAPTNLPAPICSQFTEPLDQHRRNSSNISSLAGRNLTGPLLRLDQSCRIIIVPLYYYFFKQNLMFVSTFNPALELKLSPSILNIQGHTSNFSLVFWLALLVYGVCFSSHPSLAVIFSHPSLTEILFRVLVPLWS